MTIARFVLPFLAALLVVSCPLAAFGRTLVVNAAHWASSDTGDGTADKPFKTISRAAELAEPGDTVLVHPGVYRERVSPAQGGEEGKPIVYQALNDAWSERDPAKLTVVKGSEVLKVAWQAGPQEGVFTVALDPNIFAEGNPFAVRVRSSRGGMTQGQVVVDGVPLKQVANEQELRLTAGSWLADPKGQSLAVNLPGAGKRPEDCLVEIAVRKRVFAPLKRGLAHIHVRGFVFEHACNDVAVPQMGMVSCRSGNHWVIERNVIRYARAIGLDCGNEWGIEKNPRENDGQGRLSGTGFHLVRQNIVCDNGQCGIAGLRSEQTRIVGNIVRRNAGIVPGFESGGIKMHHFYDGLIEGNLVQDNEAWGIWLDHGYEGARVTRNVVINNKSSGVFMELGEDQTGRGLVDNNIIAANRGSGVYSHDASDVWLMHNLIYGNESFGVFMQVATARKLIRRVDGQWSGVASCNRQRVQGNLILCNREGAVSFPVAGGRTADNVSDCNAFAPAPGGRLAFLVNLKNGGKTSAQAVLDEAQKAFEATGDPGLPPEQLDLFKVKGPTLTLSQWRTATKCDAGSEEVGVRDGSFDVRTFVMEFGIDDVRGITAPRVKDIDSDFFGNPMPTDQALPGPFQKLKQGKNRFVVWPPQ